MSRSFAVTSAHDLPLFAPEAVGRLTVTNKRIVYHSHSESSTGHSVLVSEMPVEDAAKC